MKKEKSIVVVSSEGYREEYLDLLRGWLDENIALFCVVGKDCEVWEEAMDNLCVKLDVSGEKPGAFCVTTSHPDETVEEVIEFAASWNYDKEQDCDVEVKEI